jgi:hypothetical protein
LRTIYGDNDQWHNKKVVNETKYSRRRRTSAKLMKGAGGIVLLRPNIIKRRFSDGTKRKNCLSKVIKSPVRRKQSQKAFLLPKTWKGSSQRIRYCDVLPSRPCRRRQLCGGRRRSGRGAQQLIEPCGEALDTVSLSVEWKQGSFDCRIPLQVLE